MMRLIAWREFAAGMEFGDKFTADELRLLRLVFYTAAKTMIDYFILKPPSSWGPAVREGGAWRKGLIRHLAEYEEQEGISEAREGGID